MRAYETVIVFKPELEKEAIDQMVERVKAIIGAAGEVEAVDEWGKRKLAYEIDKKYNEGIYFLILFKSEPSVLNELDHLYKVNDVFLRNIIIKREK